MLTLSEVTEKTGLSKAAIHKAIAAGKITATRNYNGHYLIDAAELFKVYQPDESISKQQDMVDYKLMAQRLASTQQMLRQVEHEKDNLQKRLNQSLIKNQHLQENPQPVKSLLWEKLFGHK
jgi:hypothetical protein